MFSLFKKWNKTLLWEEGCDSETLFATVIREGLVIVNNNNYDQ